MNHLVSGGITLASAIALAAALAGGADELQPSAVALALACAVVAVAAPFAPGLAPRVRDASRAWLGWALPVSALTGLGCLAIQGIAPAQAMPLAVLVLAIVTAVQAALGMGLPRAAIATGVIALMAAPLWLAPIAYLAGSTQPVSDWIVWLSPATQLAAAANCDVLRLDFLYRHSTLGTLHWSYPPPLASIVGWFAVAALGHGLSCLASRARGRTRGLTRLTLLQEPNR